MHDEQVDGPLLPRRQRWLLYGVAWTIGIAVIVLLMLGSFDSATAEARDNAPPAPAAEPRVPAPTDANRHGVPASTYGQSGEGSTAGSPGTTGESMSGNSGKPVEPSVETDRSKSR